MNISYYSLSLTLVPILALDIVYSYYHISKLATLAVALIHVPALTPAPDNSYSKFNVNNYIAYSVVYSGAGYCIELIDKASFIKLHYLS